MTSHENKELLVRYKTVPFYFIGILQPQCEPHHDYALKFRIPHFSKIQLVVYYQCCVLIG